MESALQRYWLFGLVCLGYALAVLWLLMRRRITLQSSLIYLFMLLALGGFSLLLPFSRSFYEALGFQLPSNLFFAASIGALSFLHLVALTTLSRLELRSITLTQEVALIQEELERNESLVRDLAARLGTLAPVGGQTAGSGIAPHTGRSE